HRSDGCRPDEAMAMIEGLCSSADRSSKKTLVIPRCFAVALQPVDEVDKHARNRVSEPCIPRCAGSGCLVHLDLPFPVELPAMALAAASAVAVALDAVLMKH